MARHDDRRIQVTDDPPDPRSLIPVERDVSTGMPVRFDHTDKSGRSSSNSAEPPHPRVDQPRVGQPRVGQPTAGHKALHRSGATAGRHGGWTSGWAITGVVAAVAAVAAVVFVVLRPTEDAADPAGVAAAPGPLTAAATPPVGVSTPASSGTAPTSAAGSPGGSSGGSSGAAVGSKPSTTASPRTTASPPATTTGAGAALTAPDAVGLDGTYRLTWKITAGTGAGEADVGQSGTMTFTAHRSCTADGCRTTMTGDGLYPRPPGDATGWGEQVRTETIVCREVGSNKETGGTWPQRVTTSFRSTGSSGTTVTAGTGVQRLDQVTACPKQTDPLRSNTVTMSFQRTGD